MNIIKYYVTLNLGRVCPFLAGLLTVFLAQY